ncbi:hypothetical protein SASPL_115140 [Salvia splendens]|uniref:Uncharacterized protein n=1 Tax=Salvia splendens TaxID=180675 RepID=A0A8X8Y382_SALSN|nr:hypothetical protein SASPL_115140 [Salvia splendens]
MASDLEVNTESTEPTHLEKRKMDLIDFEKRSKRRNDQEKLVASETRSKRQNNKQTEINSVKEMGFESILDFKIDSIPSILAFSLLKSFDEQECKINLNNGKSITITEEDVELVYGFPRGDINLCREKWKRNARFMRDLAEECDSKPGNVKHKAVQQLMLADHEIVLGPIRIRID